jgi:hypothetical protein
MNAPFGVIALILLNALQVAGATKSDGWDNLKHVTRHRTYTFLARDLHCVGGEIVSVTADSVTLKLPEGEVTKLERVDVLSVSGYPSYIIYSGRSSWSDVLAHRFYPTEGTRIWTKVGNEYNGKILSASDSDIAIGATDKSIKITKGDVSSVDIISYTPLSDHDEWWAEECSFLPICLLNTHLWPRTLGIGRRMRVRLYDSSLPEDNRSVTCKADL